MQQRDEAFVLKTQPLGDADLIVTLLAKSHGCIRGVARYARRSKRRFGASLQPMTHVEATWSEKQGRDLHRLEQVDGRRSFAAMQSEPLCQAVCAVFAEVTESFGREGEADDREFRLLAALLAALDEEASPQLCLRYFELWTLRIHGFAADLRRCCYCDSPLPPGQPRRVGRQDGARCAACQEQANDPGWALSGSEVSLVERIYRAKPESLKPLDPAARSGGTLERVLRGALESFAEKKFRSYRHVHAYSSLEAPR